MSSAPGHNLGYYYIATYYLFVIPLVILLLVSVGYNILVAFSVKWMFVNAWQKKGKAVKDDDKPPPIDESSWDEVFFVNAKIAGYLLGGSVALQKKNGYYKLLIHDYEVYMPTAAVFIQVSELAVMIICLTLFLDHLILQVTGKCDPDFDCFLFNETKRDALPLDCSLLNETVKVTCFHIEFTPIAAAVATGGFLKLVPQVVFSALTFKYIKWLNFVKKRLNLKANNIIAHVIIAAVLVACFIAVGLAVLFIIQYRFSGDTFSSSNPLIQLSIYFLFVMYFMMAGFVWCIYPFEYTASVGKA